MRNALRRRARVLTPAAIALAAALLTLLAGGWSTGAGAGTRVWMASPYVKLQETTQLAAWRPALIAPRGGRAAFQLVVDRGPKAQPRAGVLTGPAGARLADVAIRRVL